VEIIEGINLLLAREYLIYMKIFLEIFSSLSCANFIAPQLTVLDLLEEKTTNVFSAAQSSHNHMIYRISK